MNKPKSYLHISISNQILTLIAENKEVTLYPISTAKNGIGEKMGSECTPIGWHKIKVKIGYDQPLNTVYTARRATGEIYDTQLKEQYPQRDWILSRILWLGGLEPGKNRYGNVDTTWRYIYIHGCPDELINGKADSHGCIRMKNVDVVDLFNRVETGLKVLIE